MKAVISVLALILLYGAMFVGALATISSIGYGLYLWGSVGLAFSVSAWTAFVLWVKLVIGSLLTALVGIGLGVAADR